MRIPIETAVEGYVTDCRNRTLHEIFRYVNIGEQAGTGVQKIVAGWASRHWRKPLIREEMEPHNRTILELHMLDLFDRGILDILRLQYRGEFDTMEKNEQLALAITLSEGRLSHSRLCELSNAHPSDVSKVLRSLVEKGILSLTGSGRGAVYRFTQVAATSPDDVFGSDSSTISAPSSTISGSSSTISAPSSTISGSSSTISASSSTIKASSSTINDSSLPSNRDEVGRLLSDKYRLPFIESLDTLAPEFRASLESLAALPRAKGRMERKAVEDLIVQLCEGHFITISSLAKILNRGERTLRQDYLSKLCKEHRLKRAFPDTPNDERQAYTQA
jgi:hypothetical protein